jgi:hypothetical protein
MNPSIVRTIRVTNSLRAAVRSAFVVLGYLEHEILNSELVVDCGISLRRQPPTTSSVVLVPSIAAEISDGGALNRFWIGGLLQGLYSLTSRSGLRSARSILETNDNYPICEIHAVNTVNGVYYPGEGLLQLYQIPYRVGHAEK